MTGSASFTYSFSGQHNPSGYGFGSGTASGQIRDVTNAATVILFSGYEGAGDGRVSSSGTGSFGVIAGHTYRVSASSSAGVGAGAGGSLEVSFPDHQQRSSQSAQRTKSVTGLGVVSPAEGEKVIGGFAATPVTQQGGALAAPAYVLSYDNPNVVAFFSDTRTSSTGNPYASIVARTVSTPPRLANLSIRDTVGKDGIIVGFVIAGTGPKQVLVRVVGPGLLPYGVTNVLPDPKLQLFKGSAVIGQNDNWNSDLAATFLRAGAFSLPQASKDAALAVNLSPATYTIQASGVGGVSGVALIEVYEVP